jgi:hypothetical protein
MIGYQLNALYNMQENWGKFYLEKYYDYIPKFEMRLKKRI